MKHYYTGKGGEAEKVADKEMKVLEDSNLLFEEELKEFAKWITVGMEVSDGRPTSVMGGGWSPRRVSEITGYYTATYLQSLCKQGKIARTWLGDMYVISAEGVIQLYNMHLKKKGSR